VTTEYLLDKLARHPQSPLFARLASIHLESGRLQEAKDLCLAGIERYPEYTTAHLVLAKCFVAEQDYVSALVSLDLALLRFPDAQLPSQLQAEVKQLVDAAHEPAPAGPSVEPTDELPPSSSATPEIPMETAQPEEVPSSVEEREDVAAAEAEFSEPPLAEPFQELVEFPTELPAVAGEESLSEEESVADAQSGAGEPATPPPPVGEEGSAERLEATPPVEPSPPPVEVEATAFPPGLPVEGADLSRLPAADVEAPLAEEIAAAEPVSDEGRIVSKTLAEIYVAQREYREAIITYRLLMQQKPERTAEFRARIAELERLTAESDEE